MRTTFGLAALAGLALGFPSPVPASQADSATAYYDQETGFTFSEFKAAYSLTSNIVYRIALPSNPPSGAYDAVVQVVAPSQVGWTGLAWGGNMIKNPLTVAYPNGNRPTISSRWATAHSTPSSYTGATYTYLTAGNKVNGTHWQYTAKCSGCTQWTGANGNVRISPTSQARLAFAYSPNKASTPSSNTSTIPVHDVANYWSHDFSVGLNSNFDALLAKNGAS